MQIFCEGLEHLYGVLISIPGTATKISLAPIRQRTQACRCLPYPVAEREGSARSCGRSFAVWLYPFPTWPVLLLCGKMSCSASFLLQPAAKSHSKKHSSEGNQ